jgi:hypothetical protein
VSAAFCRDLRRYVVTEPNAYFRRCNQRKLATQFPNLPLEWSTVDLDSPWSGQGIGSGEFDLVYAVNVMHISKNLLFSLNEARSALAADGWLVIGECVRPYDNQPIYPELMFQILDSFNDVETDPEFRPNPGFLTGEQWRRAFLKAGFTRTEVAPDIERIREIYPHFFTGAICGQNTANRKMISEVVGSKRSEADRWVSFPGARHTGVAGSDCVDRRTSRPAASEAVVISDHSLLSDHGACGATGILRVLEAGAGSFSPLVERVAPFLLFRRYDFGPRLFITWRIQQILHHNSRKRSVAAPK